MVSNTNLEGKSSGLGYARLAAVAIGATIGGGVFSLAGDMVANGANTAPVIVGWIICGIGMLTLTMCFFGLNKIKPHLTGGIYSYTISASMIMIPYLLSAMYYLLITFRKDGFVGESTKTINMARFIGVLGTIYGCWLIYASGLTGLLITAILYVQGTLVYIKAKKEKGEKCFETSKDKIILGIIVVMAILSLILIFNGTITPF